jgi:hypothetical protein
MSRTGLTDDYALLGSYDRPDYKVYKLNQYKSPMEWEWKMASADVEYLGSNLQGKGTEPLGEDPLVWTRANPFEIGLGEPFFLFLSDSLDQDGVPVMYDSLLLETGDFLYFESQDWNAGFDGIVANPAYRESVDVGLVSDTADEYWDYEYEIEIFPGEPSYFAVTAFDVGNPQTGLFSLEGSKQANATLVYPFDDPAAVKKKGSEVIVYPNPYRIDGNYYADGYEPGQGNFERRLNFVNLPTRCTIRIYTLDGDLVRTLEHDKQEGDLDATYHYWDLVSRNIQAVVSGIYLFCVEDKETGETQVGKFVIIK